MKEKCLKTLSECRERRCRCHVWWETVPEASVRNEKSPFVDSREVERRYSKLVRGSRPESLSGWHISDTGEVWRQICWCTAVQSSEGHYGDLEQDALLNAKSVEADELVSRDVNLFCHKYLDCDVDVPMMTMMIRRRRRYLLSILATRLLCTAIFNVIQICCECCQ